MEDRYDLTMVHKSIFISWKYCKKTILPDTQIKSAFISLHMEGLLPEAERKETFLFEYSRITVVM